MLGKTNLEERLVKLRGRRINTSEILAEVEQILSDNEEQRDDIRARLTDSSKEVVTPFNLDILNSEFIFHQNDIKKLCIDYRLRFLDAHFFKGEFP